MPYIGKEPEHGNYQRLDALTLPDGVFNGSRTVFNLTADGVSIYPTSPATMIISLGGVIQEPNESYTVTGDTITFAPAPARSSAIARPMPLPAPVTKALRPTNDFIDNSLNYFWY